MTIDSASLDRLAARTGLAGAEWHATIGSTNDRGLALAVGGHPFSPWLIGADEQTAGRGRSGNRWWSGPGALTFSLVWRFPPAAAAAPPAQLSLAAGLGICEAIGRLLPAAHARLKWPNDVYLDSRKLCGILVEVPSSSPCAVIGVGVNVNNSTRDAPEELRDTATSLCDVAGGPLDRLPVLEVVLQCLLEELARLAHAPGDLRERWADRCFLAGRIVHLESAAGRAVGLCLGIDSDGALLLQSEAGPSRHTSGTVRRIE